MPSPQDSKYLISDLGFAFPVGALAFADWALGEDFIVTLAFAFDAPSAIGNRISSFLQSETASKLALRHQWHACPSDAMGLMAPH